MTGPPVFADGRNFHQPSPPRMRMITSGISHRAGPRLSGSGGGTNDGLGASGWRAGEGALDKDDMFSYRAFSDPTI